MIIYGTEVKGPFYPEKLSTLPVYTASDEGRVVYVDDVNKVYYGSDSAWVEIGSQHTDKCNRSYKFSTGESRTDRTDQSAEENGTGALLECP